MKKWIQTAKHVIACGLIVGGSSLFVSPAYAYESDPHFHRWQGSTFVPEVQQIYSSLRNAFNSLGDLIKEIYRLENQIRNNVSQLVSNSLQQSTQLAQNGAVGQALRQNGTSFGALNNTVGHVSSDFTNSQLRNSLQASNPVEAITLQTQIHLEGQFRDRINVGSFLDEKPANGQCTTIAADKCTVLKLLREKEAVSLQKLHNQALLSGNLAAEIGTQWRAFLLMNIKEGSPRVNSKEELITFLTAENSVPLGYDKANSPKVHTLQRARLLADVMAGTKNDIGLLAPNTIRPADTILQSQLDAMSRLSKIQIAKAAIMNVHNDELHDAMNNQFKACVGRPDAQDTVGSTSEQHLVQIQSLLRCNNMILMQSQQRQLESDRLSGAILLTLLDLYAVQAPQETRQQ